MIDFACKKFELYEIIKCGFGLTKSDFHVMEFLMKHRERYNSQGIAKALKLDLSTAQRALKKLNEKNIVVRSQLNLANGGYVYNYKINDKTMIKKMMIDIIHRWIKKFEEELDKW
ncbi:MAG: helix-turn-helix domain-containing protein [Nanoarchaeota archaeon]|nr:helix-turn-helix domain-containing protein [Nanoarchaeota archaeon]